MTEPTPLDATINALHTAAIRLEEAAERARMDARQLTAAARCARMAYEDATIHSGAPRCGAAETDRWGHIYGPCARPADHPEAYHRNAAGSQHWMGSRSEYPCPERTEHRD